MCILFIYVPKKPSSTSVEKPSLKLVLASNRDEQYARPTKQAGFWESDLDILAGQDAKEGGTWLGITKTGKLATLLNIMSKTPEEKKKSRGDIITGFLRSPPGLRGWTYCNNLHQDPDIDARNNFGLFNLITIDLVELSHEHESNPLTGKGAGNNKCLDITYYTNATENGPKNLAVDDDNEIYGFGNSVHDKPFCKVSDGCRSFGNIIKSFKHKTITETVKADLKEHVIEFLQSQEKHFPDEQMQQQAKDALVPTQFLPELSKIFVKNPTTNYGTRTHTLIIIDSENCVDFHEWTLQEPIDIKNPKWVESKFQFALPVENLK